MKGIYCFSIFISFLIRSTKIYNLRCLPFFLFYFTFSHSDFHICFTQALHWRGWCSWVWTITWTISTFWSTGSWLPIFKCILKSALKFLQQISVSFNMCNQVEFQNRISWNIWCFIFKSSMHEYCLIISCPDGMSKSLNWIKLFPFRIFSFIDFHKNIFTNSICSTSQNNHQSSNENSGMLISS